MKPCSFFIYVLLVMNFLFITTASSQVYELIELPMQYAQDINDSGVVVGDATLWENGLSIGTSPVYGDGINNKKQVAGSALVSADTIHAFLWEDYILTDMGTLGGLQAGGKAINNSAQVAGFSYTPQGTHPFFWENGVMTDLGVSGIAEGINDSGQVVGEYLIDDSTSHAFIWQNGNLSDLGALPGAYHSYARAINNAGQVVGNSTLETNSGMVAVLWNGGSITNLGRLIDSLWSFSYAYDINDAGEVVGYSIAGGTPFSPRRAAFIWKNGVMTDLNSVTDTSGGWELRWAVAINNQGDILCWGIYKGIPNVRSVLLKRKNIHVTRPSAGDLWFANNKEEIRWLAPKGKRLNLYYIEDTRAKLQIGIPIAQNISSDSEKYVWKIPDGLNSRFSAIMIEDADDISVSGSSKNFRIRTLEMVRFNVDSTYTRFQHGQDSWIFNNTSADMWPISWTNLFHYQDGVVPDPYLQKPYPDESPFDSAKGTDFPDWPLFVSTFGVDRCYQPTWLGLSTDYNQFATAKWKAIKGAWRGSCGGMSLSTILGFDNRQGVVARYPSYPSTGNIHGVTITDSLRLILNELQHHWHGKQHLDYFASVQNIRPRQLINVIKDAFLDESNDHRYLYISWKNSAGEFNAHAVVPYKLEGDTTRAGWYNIRVYDVSYPASSIATVQIDSTGDSALAPFWSAKKLERATLMDPVSTYLQPPVFGSISTPLATTTAMEGYPSIEIWPSGNSSVRVERFSGGFIEFRNDSLVNTIPFAVAFIPPTASPSPPVVYALPQNSYRVALAAFKNGHAGVSKFSYYQSYSYERFDADSTQADMLTFDDGMSVGSHDVAPKKITIESIGNYGGGSIKYRLSDVSLLQEDSVRMVENNGEMTLTNRGSQKAADIFVKRAYYYRPVSTFRHSAFVIPSNAALLFSAGDDSIGTLRVLTDNDLNGTFDDTTFIGNQLTGVDELGYTRTPKSFTLHQNYPNPFNPRTTITYELPKTTHITIKVYDVFGREVAILVDGVQTAGVKSVEWNAGNFASGIYFYRLTASSFTSVKKMSLIK